MTSQDGAITTSLRQRRRRCCYQLKTTYILWFLHWRNRHRVLTLQTVFRRLRCAGSKHPISTSSELNFALLLRAVNCSKARNKKTTKKAQTFYAVAMTGVVTRTGARVFCALGKPTIRTPPTPSSLTCIAKYAVINNSSKSNVRNWQIWRMAPVCPDSIITTARTVSTQVNYLSHLHNLSCFIVHTQVLPLSYIYRPRQLPSLHSAYT